MICRTEGIPVEFSYIVIGLSDIEIGRSSVIEILFEKRGISASMDGKVEVTTGLL